jgi:hypothetical protein
MFRKNEAGDMLAGWPGVGGYVVKNKMEDGDG